MKVLSPIDVESFENQFKILLHTLEEASNELLPDAYQTEKDLLLSARQLILSQFAGFNEVINSCSAGVIFNESVLTIPAVEGPVNMAISDKLWKCQDIISSIILFNIDLNIYIENLTVNDPMVWKIDQLLSVKNKFNSVVDALESASDMILSVLVTLDSHNI